jgi:hypothetical protein
MERRYSKTRKSTRLPPDHGVEYLSFNIMSFNIPLTKSELDLICFALDKTVRIEGMPFAVHGSLLWAKLIEIRSNESPALEGV